MGLDLLDVTDGSIKKSNNNALPATHPASTHRRSHIRRARQRESRFWMDSRPESKTSNQWVKPFHLILSSWESLNQLDHKTLIHVINFCASSFFRHLNFLACDTTYSPSLSSHTFSLLLLSLLAPLQVMNETEQYLQQLLMRAVAVLPQWRVRVQKCKAIQMVLNLCSPSVTEKCLIAEAWCPVSQLPALQSALREGGVRIQHSCNQFSLLKEHSISKMLASLVLVH